MPIKPDLRGINVWDTGSGKLSYRDARKANEVRTPVRGEQQRQALDDWRAGRSRRMQRYMISMEPPLAEWIRTNCGHGNLSKGMRALAKLAQTAGVEHLGSASRGEDVELLRMKLSTMDNKFESVLNQLLKLSAKIDSTSQYLPRKGARNSRIRVDFGVDSSGSEDSTDEN